MYKYLLSLFVIPHGITDIIFSYENDRLLLMTSIYTFAPLTLIYINISLYRFIFIILSMIHFYHDPYPFIPYYLMILYFVGELSYYEAINYMTFYLTFIHTPIHYYEAFSLTNYYKLHLSLIGIMTIISSQISPIVIDYIEITNGSDKISKYIGGIIISHILFNEVFMFQKLLLQ